MCGRYGGLNMNCYLKSGKKADCCGCMNCMYKCPVNAITEEIDEEGFKYPRVNMEKCIQCGLCEKVCSFETMKLQDMQSAYAMKHKNDDVRMASSSGGAFTAITDYFLDHDYKIYGAILDEEMQVVHVGSKEKVLRDKMRGSKYVQSNLSGVYEEIEQDLKKGEKVLFSGTPCQVNALSLYLGQEYSNLFTVDIICHGVISPRFFQDYLKLVSKGSKIKSYVFRDKNAADWGTHKASIVCGDEENKQYLPYFMNAFNRRFAFRPSCHNCKFTKTERSSDITMADFWGIQSIDKDFGDSKGVSLVCVNTDKGAALFDSLFDGMTVLPVDKNIVKGTQVHLSVACEASVIRKEFWKYYNKHGAEKMLHAYCSDTLMSKLRRKPLEMIKSRL